MTEVNLQPAQGGDTQAHIDAMVAKASGQPAPAAAPAAAPTDAPARPAWLPEGFDTPEALAEAYKATQVQKTADPDTQQKADEAAAKAVENAGLDMAALEAKLLETGTLEDADYEALAKGGITREMANAYIEGQKALGEALVTRMHATVGGEEQFNSILTWAGTNLSKPEIDAFNRVVDSGDEATVKLALEGLAAKYSNAGQQRPQLLGGQRAPASNDAFRSVAEMTAAMRDPRYAKDAAYRADVEAKLSRSNIM